MNFPSVSSFSIAKGNTKLNYNTFNIPATVVNSAYDTSGNGGRKLVRLSNGKLIAFAKDGLNIRRYQSTDNGTTWTAFNSYATVSTSLQDIALETNGDKTYVLVGQSNTTIAFYTHNNDGTQLQSNVIVDSGQTAMGNCSLTYNASDNTLHAAWASKNSTYPNSFNIRYAKGTINADGSVTWGAVLQKSTYNTAGYFSQNPSIIIKGNSQPSILYEWNNGSNNGISIYNYDGVTWTTVSIFPNGSYTQSNASAIFVPQSINGLANGRVWVAWHGNDSTYANTTFPRLVYSYSDDVGVTWSTRAYVDSGAAYSYPSITCDSAGKIQIVATYTNAGTSSFGGIRSWAWNGTSFGPATVYTIDSYTNSATYPSALYDSTFSTSFLTPSFICKSVSAVKFIGDSNNQMLPTPPEMYIPLWWYSGSSSSNTGTNSYIQKGTTSVSASTTSGAKLHTLNVTWSPNQKYSFEVCLSIGNSSYTATAYFYDVTANAPVSGSTITTTSTIATVLRSGQFTLIPGHIYGVTYYGSASYAANLTDASLIVFPS